MINPPHFQGSRPHPPVTGSSPRALHPPRGVISTAPRPPGGANPRLSRTLLDSHPLAHKTNQAGQSSGSSSRILSPSGGQKGLMDCSLVKKLVNLVMIKGKKNRAYKTLSQAGAQFSLLSGELGGNIQAADRAGSALPPVRGGGKSLHPLPAAPFLLQLRAAVENVQPSLECKKCRIAGTSYQVPAICTPERGRYLALRWIVEAARKRTKNSRVAFSRSLALELLDAVHKRGGPRERRNQCHKLSEANRGYLRYRWW